MTKPLSTLISECCDVEEAATEYATNNLLVIPFTRDFYNSYKAGAAHVAAKLGPALIEALRQRDQYAHEYRTDAELNLSMENQKILALLEGGAE